MRPTNFLLFLLLPILTEVQSSSQSCVLKGECTKKTFFTGPLPCVVVEEEETAGFGANHQQLHQPPPQPVSSPSTSLDDHLLAQVCGQDFVGGGQGEGIYCCDSAQLETLRQSLAMAHMFVSSCPACWLNMKSLFCSMTCGANQRDFMRVVASRQTPENKTVATEVDLFVDPKFATGFFDSCKGVKFGSANEFAMTFIGGGAKTPRAMFKFMGDVKPQGSPFQINFPLLSERNDTNGIIPLNLLPNQCGPTTISRSNTSTTTTSSFNPHHCSCLDCQDSCPLLDDSIAEKVQACSFNGYSCSSIGFVSGFIAAITALVVMLLEINRSSHRDTRARRDRREGGGINYHIDDNEENESLLPQRQQLGSSSLSSIITSPLNSVIQHAFHNLGLFCSKYAYATILTAFVLIALTSLGWAFFFSVEIDPVKLWVAPTSQTAREKSYYDDHFDPFYRTQQLIVSRSSNSSSMEALPVLNRDALLFIFEVEKNVSSLRVPVNLDNNSSSLSIGLDDLCLKPVKGECVVSSVTGFWQGSVDKFLRWGPLGWKECLELCIAHPVSCLPRHMQPLKNNLIFGSSKFNSNSGSTTTVLPSFNPETQKDVFANTEALIVTWVLKNNRNETWNALYSEAWERAFVEFFSEIEQQVDGPLAQLGLRISYSSESSIKREINRETTANVFTIILSYLVMFFYIALSLGGFSKESCWSLSSIITSSKFSLSIAGILLVLSSVSVSFGILSLAGVKTTLIIAEVIPFLVLAIGVDNMFILVNAFERTNLKTIRNKIDGGSEHGPEDTDYILSPLEIEMNCATTLAEIGPSILLSSISEIVAFGLGSIVDMPAVAVFSMYASVAVLVGSVLQVTVFVSFMCLDGKRKAENRVDCLPCIRLPPSLTVGTDIGILESFIKHYYTPWLLSSKVKRAVLSGFSVSFLVTLFLSQLVEFGMDQRLALPRNSYLIDYFNDMESYLGVGPPVYFVTRDVNLTDASNQRAICGRFSGCELKSMTVQLEQERKRPTLSFIAEPTASWLDDFFLWLDPAVTSCCRVKKTKKPEQVLHLSSPLVSPPPPPHFCSDADDEDSCESCFASRPWNSSLVGLPQGPEFIAYLQRFISSIPSEECPLGGKAAYESAVSIDESFLFVNSSSFRTFHTPLKTQRDYIGAYLQARRIAQEITQESGVPVFPYSVFYVFFSQYATIFQLTTFIVVSACVAIFGISWILLSSLVSAALILIVVAMILVNLLGVMGVWGVSLNAVSTVNLGIAVGISVEYLSHLTRAFMVSPGFSRDERVAKAMADVGSSIFSGITLTKFVGVSVLAFSTSRIFEVYYFRMYAAIIVLGALHGLVLLPILLSWFGDDRVLIGPFDDYASRQSFKDPATASSLGENTALQDEERFQRLD